MNDEASYRTVVIQPRQLTFWMYRMQSLLFENTMRAGMFEVAIHDAIANGMDRATAFLKLSKNHQRLQTFQITVPTSSV